MSRYLELAAEPTTWQRLRAWPWPRIAATAFGTLVAAAVVTAYLCSVAGLLPADPDAMDLETINALPSREHPLGTDFVGRDLLSRVMVGTQAFFLPGLLSVSVSLLLGALFGVLTGYWPERFGTPVGLLLQALEQRVGWVGRFVVKLIGVAWTLATFLVVPVLVTRDVGPIDAVKASAALLRETWGENLIGTVGLGLAFAAAYLVVLLAGGGLILLAINAGLPFITIVVLLLSIVVLVVLSALQATMQGVYSAALYRHATEPGRPSAGFTPELMAVAFKPKG